MKKQLLYLILAKNFASALVTCSPEPIASSSPFQSVLHTWPESYIEYVGERRRLSTCTGVIWTKDNKLLSVGVHNLSIDAYQFDPDAPSLFGYRSENLSIYQETQLGQLENITTSSDGSLAALSNNGAAAVHIYTISNGAELNHVAEIPKVGWWVHGVRFSQEMDYLVYTLFGTPGKLLVFRMLKNEQGDIYFDQTQEMDTSLSPLHPKGIDFSIDDRFVAVCHAINNSKAPNKVSGVITVYPFDKILGKIDPIAASQTGILNCLSVPEDLCFHPSGSCILVANHGNDTVTIHEFDQKTGCLGESRVLLQNPEAQLSFPHGLCISPDGKYLAVTNYGDDTVKIYTLNVE